MFISTAWSRSEPHCTQRTLSYGDLLKGILSFKTHQPDAVNHSRRLLLCCLWALTVRSKSKVKQRNKRVTMYKRWKTRQIMGKWCVFFCFFCGKRDQQVLTRLYSSRSICFPYSLHANSCSTGCGASAARLLMKVEIYNEKKKSPNPLPDPSRCLATLYQRCR